MSIPSTLESLSVTAASNGPSGSDQRTLADDGLRQAYAFIRQLQNLATLASGTTVTPPSTANTFSVTGVTAITTIASTNSWDGRNILFVFAGIMTLTHGSNLILPGSANITTAVGDAALLTQIASGQWRCIGYSRADGSILVTTQPSLTLTGNLTVNGNTTLGNAGTDTITTTGSVTINQPTGVALTIGDATDAKQHAQFGDFHINKGVAFAADTTELYSAAPGGIILDTDQAAAIIALRTNNLERMRIAAAGPVTISAPTSGVPLTVNGSGAIQRFTTTTARGSGANYIDFFDPTGAKAFLGYPGSDDTMRIQQALNSGIDIYTNNTIRVSITNDGRFYGTAIHNNAGAVTGTTNQYIASGTYTPTLTGVSNVAASTPSVCGWIRVGNMVSVWGSAAIDPTSATTLTRLGISLPIASNLVANDLWGTCSVDQGLTTAVNLSGGVQPDGTNDRAELYYVTAADVANRGVNFTFGYIVQ